MTEGSQAPDKLVLSLKARVWAGLVHCHSSQLRGPGRKRIGPGTISLQDLPTRPRCWLGFKATATATVRDAPGGCPSSLPSRSLFSNTLSTPLD